MVKQIFTKSGVHEQKLLINYKSSGKYDADFASPLNIGIIRKKRKL